MATKYPDILRVDFQGRKRKFGDRHNSCPSSPTYKRFAPAIAGALARRYKNSPALKLWHISNEFGGACYCENCERAFRVWLEKRYITLEVLNTAWNTSFWNQTITAWHEIVVPNQLNVQWSERGTAMQGLVLDFNRFNSENLLDAYSLEYDAIKLEIPDAKITTNLMGAYRPLDYRSWAKRMDVTAWDSYPAPSDSIAITAMKHALMRGLKHGEPFFLMEQTPSQTNWQQYNALKRPGVMRLQSWQAVAHGADAVMFFQMRRSIGAGEKFHGAVIEHSGRSDTRVFKEVAAFGKELKQLGNAILGSIVQARAAIWFDWESWWASENSLGPSAALNYLAEVAKYHAGFHQANIAVDMIGADTNLEQYKILVAPIMYLLNPGVAEKVIAWVNAGGTLVTSFMSGVANSSDLIFPGGMPGPFKTLLGLWVEEIDALPPEQTNQIVLNTPLGNLNGSFDCNLLFEIIRLEDAEIMATYGQDFYAGTPALTRKQTGKGSAWHVASSPNAAFINGLLEHLCAEIGIQAVLPDLPDGVEVTCRSKAGQNFYFILNHNPIPVTFELGTKKLFNLLEHQDLTGSIELLARGVIVAQEKT